MFSGSVVSDSLRPHGLHHARLPCPSLSPRVCSDSCPLSQWCHLLSPPSPMVVLVAQSCPTLCNPTDCSPPGSSVPGILQARTLELLPFPPPEDPDSRIDPGLLHRRWILYHLSSREDLLLYSPSKWKRKENLWGLPAYFFMYLFFLSVLSTAHAAPLAPPFPDFLQAVFFLL